MAHQYRFEHAKLEDARVAQLLSYETLAQAVRRRFRGVKFDRKKAWRVCNGRGCSLKTVQMVAAVLRVRGLSARKRKVRRG